MNEEIEMEMMKLKSDATPSSDIENSKVPENEYAEYNKPGCFMILH